MQKRRNHLSVAQYRQLVPKEHDEAVLLARYLDALVQAGTILCYSHIPHETYTTSWAAKRRNKQEGVNPGVPDYLIVTPARVIFLELKRVKGGRVSGEQAMWLADLADKPTTTAVAQGFEQAKEVVDNLV